MPSKGLFLDSFSRLGSFLHRRCCRSTRGQALVEFTLIFLLLLIVAWIPADFGLGFYTGHLALNASREGARIAAADRTLLTQTGGGTINCTLPCSGEPASSVLA